MALSSRNLRTLDAVTRTLVPSGGAIEVGAEELGLVAKLARETEEYPPRAHRRMRLLLFAIEHLPLASGHVRRFSHLSPKVQRKFLERTAHHKRSPLRRLLVSYLKQFCYASYLSQPEVEEAIGYRYECLRPRQGVDPQPGEQIHH